MRFMHRFVVVMPMFFVTVGARAAAAQTAPTDPCAQLTPAQVSTALGETVSTGQKSGTKTCTWVANKPTHQIVSLMYFPPGDWNTIKTPMMGVTKTAVGGIGDDALAVTLEKFVTLYVKKGNTTFMVKVYGGSDTARELAIEKSIAQAIAAKF
jgi:hypothetical protein